jgi:hypothetical protein
MARIGLLVLASAVTLIVGVSLADDKITLICSGTLYHKGEQIPALDHHVIIEPELGVVSFYTGPVVGLINLPSRLLGTYQITKITEASIDFKDGVWYLRGRRWGGTMREIALITVLMLGACAPVKAERFVGPNGGTGYSMKCSGMGRTQDDCYKKAGEMCPMGYLIIDRATGTICSSYGCAPQHNLAIECKSKA